MLVVNVKKITLIITLTTIRILLNVFYPMILIVLVTMKSIVSVKFVKKDIF